MNENHTRSAPARTVRSIDGATVVTWHGEIDLVTAIPLASRLDALTSGPHPGLVLDLRSVSFIDCSGLSVLCRTRNRVLARHGRLRLVTDSDSLLRVLRVTGLGGVFEIHPHLPSAGGERPRPLPGTGPERSFGNASSAQATA
ncbi:STAS domain-containing protein [Streptomyces sp. NPDC051642]|uniref:STAS domain-containing protein n=1 Tax=Streptomyces sp. NPDC051642 TaxID=3154646 RepID=UPI003440C25C